MLQAKQTEADRRRARNELLVGLLPIAVDALPHFEDVPTQPAVLASSMPDLTFPSSWASPVHPSPAHAVQPPVAAAVQLAHAPHAAVQPPADAEASCHARAERSTGAEPSDASALGQEPCGAQGAANAAVESGLAEPLHGLATVPHMQMQHEGYARESIDPADAGNTDAIAVHAHHGGADPCAATRRTASDAEDCALPQSLSLRAGSSDMASSAGAERSHAQAMDAPSSAGANCNVVMAFGSADAVPASEGVALAREPNAATGSNSASQAGGTQHRARVRFADDV